MFQPTGPVEFGRGQLDAALLTIRQYSRQPKVEVRVAGKGAPESYTIDTEGSGATIVGTDASGAMYGEMELAERIRMHGGTAFEKNHVEGKPYLHDRGLNLFLTLPWDYVKNDTDYDPKALRDPKRWFFQNEGYWAGLLDLMAKSRFNWLDIHGTWDTSVTSAPNLYAYFIQSDKYPEVGVAADLKAANLKMLKHVIDMAHARGIRVSLMSYEARLRIPQNPTPPYKEDEATLYDYTRDVVEKMIRQAPGLDAIGFRIGESGKGESFFNCYHEAVKRSGRDIPLITRSWITRKANVVPLARKSNDFTVEIKYNGEQWGAPYMVAGGRVANWHSYSFEDYLSDSGPGVSRKMWAGNPTDEGTTWPAEPYKVVWQVRANGTHRIFPFYNPDWVRRSIKCMKVGTASGYTIEGEDAYYPKSPEYYLANKADQYCDWIYQRDEMYWMTWGRLGYDPETPEAVFDHRASELLGKDSEPLVTAWKAASVLVPTAFMAYALGPDHRDHAPELEWGGDTDAFIQGQPFDSMSFMPINEEWANRATGGIDGRYSLWDLAVGWNSLPDLARQVEPFVGSSKGRKREISNAVTLLVYLGDYYRCRFKSAHQMAGLESQYLKPLQNENTRYAEEGAGVLGLIASNPYYRPFTERLRMHTNTFAWSSEAQKAKAEADRLKALPEAPEDFQFYAANMSGSMDGKLTWSDKAGIVTANLSGPNMGRAWLLVKPLPSSTYFHKIPMKKTSSGFEASFARENFGHAIAAEATSEGDPTSAGRFPSSQSTTPYMLVPARPGPTAQIYNSEEAMSYLDARVLSPEKFGAILIGTRANDFFQRFDIATKRKLLPAVENGLKLVILQEDFTKDKLDFLPRPLRFENAVSNTFDPGGQLGLSNVAVEGIMYQRFLPSEGWEVFGNGGLARLKLGKGEVWVTSARLMQSMHISSAAKAFVKMLSIGGKTKPTVLVDSCSEGGPFTSSCHPDLMNSHEIPFLTLGEVIAKEQGMNSIKPVPGLVTDDAVLGGRGPAMMKKFVDDKVRAEAALPLPKTKAEMDARRPKFKKELMRSLGLDPLPPRTPLNVRITGGFKRNGYRVENIVLDSRPGFPVTANLYIPDGSEGKKLPVIVNPHGHWQWKKSQPVVQHRAIFQALHGYLAIVVDTPGFSFEGDTPVERRYAGTHDDIQLVLGSTNTTGVYVWDLMRVMDYLETRPEADMSRVGITGASGGGLATLYAFAADERYKVGVPVVYAVSLEVQPNNGCLCNHVPAQLQIGDRSDVLAIRAPAPVLLIGATEDSEFPPAGTKLTGEKIRKIWDLYGTGDSTAWKVFPGPHDYNTDMQSLAIGFFDKHLKGVGDGSPVPSPAFNTEPADSKELVCLPNVPSGLATMRDIAKASLAQAGPMGFGEVVKLNGGLPTPTHLDFKELDSQTGDKRPRHVTFASEKGLTIPGILRLPNGRPKAGVVLVSEGGKVAAEKDLQAQKLVDAGYATLSIDARGTGELGGLDDRLMTYLGTSDAFAMGWDASRAAEALAKFAPKVGVAGEGAAGSQAAMFAALMNPEVAFVAGLGGIHEYMDCFDPGVTEMAIQPRASLGAPLSHLRSLVKARSQWTFRGDAVPDMADMVGRLLR